MEGAYYLLRGSATSIEKGTATLCTFLPSLILGQTLGGWTLDKSVSSIYNGASYVAGKVRDAGVFVFQLPARSYTEVTRYVHRLILAEHHKFRGNQKASRAILELTFLVLGSRLLTHWKFYAFSILATSLRAVLRSAPRSA